LVLSDTAGIHHTEYTVEKIGVEKSRRYIDSADLVIVVIDSTNNLDDDDTEILNATDQKTRIILLNKTDMDSGKSINPQIFSDDTVIEVSAKTGVGMDKLSDEIVRLCGLDKISSENGAIITNMRHKTALINAKTSLFAAAQALTNGMPTDIVSIDIAAAMDSLGEITGETVSESVVDNIFHNFCVGK
jgi:tRNA modification GTPase